MSSTTVPGEALPDPGLAPLVGRLADRGTVAAALGRLEAATADFDALNLDALSDTDVLAVAGRLEALARSHAVADHRVMARLARLSPREFGAKSVVELIATRLRISRRATHTRLRAAALLNPQLPVTGPALPPKLPATAAAVAVGLISSEHVTVIAEDRTGLIADDAGREARVSEDQTRPRVGEQIVQFIAGQRIVDRDVHQTGP